MSTDGAELRRLPALGAVLSSIILGLNAVLAAGDMRPNIIVVQADDLGTRMKSAEKALPRTRKFFRKYGAEFVNSFVTTPVCCPSRSSFLTGQYAHNHGALTNNNDCYSKRWQKEVEPRTVGVFLQRAGYYTGKMADGACNLRCDTNLW